jgi:hypothetical protein
MLIFRALGQAWLDYFPSNLDRLLGRRIDANRAPVQFFVYCKFLQAARAGEWGIRSGDVLQFQIEIRETRTDHA